MQKHTLKNGLTVLLNPFSHVNSVAIGVIAKTGSAHESLEESGISHFCEHMLFRGTKTRTAQEISTTIEGRGGMLNAHTSKEDTCYYARVVDSEFSVALEVLADMYQNSLFEESEIELERGVILEEIAQAQNDPESYVHDLHISKRWKDSPYGREILGTNESVSRLGATDMLNYVKKWYTAPNTIVSIAGNFDPEKALKQITSLFGDLSSKDVESLLQKIKSTPESIVLKSNSGQVYFSMAYDAPDYTNPERHVVQVLNKAFGGETYSRLFQEIREKRGLAYSVGSYHLSYRNGGLLTAYGGVNKQNWDTVYNIILEEMDDICRYGLYENEIGIAKKTLIGQFALQRETPLSIMIIQAQNEMHFGCERTTEQYISGVNSVQNLQIIEFVRQTCSPSQSSFALIGAPENKRGLWARIFGK